MGGEVARTKRAQVKVWYVQLRCSGWVSLPQTSHVSISEYLFRSDRSAHEGLVVDIWIDARHDVRRVGAHHRPLIDSSQRI